MGVGYVTAAGMAWLARRTQGRRVSLLIGDAHPKWWKNVKSSDRAACLAFMRRPDVEIRNWYRTKKSRHGESFAHFKVWAVHQQWAPIAVLAGSGNLTRNGLEGNVEVMVEAHENDVPHAWGILHSVWLEAWPCADRISRYLDGSAARSEFEEWRDPSFVASQASTTVSTPAAPVIRPTHVPPAPGPSPAPPPRRPIPGMMGAGIGRRMAARLIDAGICLLFVALASLSIDFEEGTSAFVLGVLCYVLYEILAVRMFGTTIGKRAAGISIMSARSAQKPTLGQSTGRLGILTVLLCVPLIGPLLCLASVLSGHRDPLKRSWHDRATKTLALATDR